MTNDGPTSTTPYSAKRPKVMVAGCFDLLHASHVVFLNKAASLGDLYVSLGADQSILQQKNKQPTYSQAERKFLLENLRCVKWVDVVNDPSPLGFVEHLGLIRPDIFVINEDGDTPEKRQVCAEHGIEYIVFPRDHFLPEAPTSSTDIAKGSYIPTRVSLCSGFMDNPRFNAATLSGYGHLVVLPIEPFAGLRDRSGMASSTIKTVRRYFGCQLPTLYSPDRLAEIIFCLENPPDKRGYISGTLDARGIVGTGASLFRYPANAFFPDRIDVEKTDETLTWLESHLYLKHSWDRPPDCAVTVRSDHPQFSSHAEVLDKASLDCWKAIQSRDLIGLAAAINGSHRAQCEVVENHCPTPLRSFIDEEANARAAMIMGAGGGGYVLFIADRIPHVGIPIRIRRGGS